MATDPTTIVFRTSVAPRERLLLRAKAVDLNATRSMGSDNARGQLYLTDHALWHWREGEAEPEFHQHLIDLSEASVSRSVRPWKRDLHLFSLKDPVRPSWNFRVNRRVARAILHFINEGEEPRSREDFLSSR